MNCISEGASDTHEENSSASSLSVSTDASRHHEFHKSDEISPRVSMNKALKSEAAFIDFVMSLPEELQRSEDSMSSSTNCRRGAPKTQANTSKVGLDHLDNLCKLMEQLGELRDNNNKLQKRVQYLEDLRTLHDMHKEIREGIEPEEEPPPFKLQKSSTETRCAGGPPSRTPSKHRRSSFSARRERSKSVGHEEVEDPKSKSIFPKWSRVKEALGWESERKDSVKMKGESYRQSIRRSSDESKSSTKRGNEEDSPPVLQSSTEEVHALIQRCAADNWRQSTCDKRLSLLEPPTDGLRRQKSTPSPGSDQISNRQTLSLKQKSLTLERDICSEKAFQRFEKDDAKRGKSPWGRVKTIIERRRDSLKRRPLRREPEKNLGPLEPLDICGNLMEDVEKGASKDSEATPSSSPPFHRKSRWTRVKKALKGKREGESSSQSTPASPGEAAREGNFNFDALEEMSQDSSEGPVRVGSEGQVHRLAVPNHALMLELERNLSDDFHRKIREWERIKKKPQESAKVAPIKPKLKDLAWLDKELRKIEKEKQRLSKERSKYEERAFRLEKLRETVLSARSSTKKEVLVRTSAGEFRFEGISDDFTKKLYEWETKRGVGPELSTIALLDSSCQSGPSQPKLSRSESSLAEVGQHSHNSSNSLPSLMPHEDPDRLNQHSRANSEPDLSTLVAFANGANLKGSLESLGCPEEICRSDVDEEEDAETERRKRKDSEKYYGLLEENVILLEQLKDKEELCRRLEKELEMLDEKVEDMGAKHTQQMERYREKLWEMHKPGTSPTAVQSCLATIAQLRKRIETLEWCTEKLRSDRESIEDSFRYHSKQQETMTLDLLEKMRELQAAGSNAGISDSQVEKQECRSNLDSNAVERLQELSALLVQQTEELEATLSAKTRQICELRWELLHRDLSTVKLETELHTQTAHTKRTKYAHFRSLSSEEASSRHLQNAAVVARRQNLQNKSLVGCSEKELFGSKEGGFRAKELSNTVHQLNRELLRLSSANETSTEDKLEACGSGESPEVTEEASIHHGDNEIKVRRSSADNVNARWSAADRARSSSSEDSSEEESFTRVSWCSGKRVEDPSSSAMVLVRNREERLLMSPGEQHPGSRIQRRKRVSRNNSGRKRFTAHPLPQKCQSFRETRERIADDSRNISSDSKLNLRGSATVKPEERIPKTHSQSFSSQDDARQKLFESVLSPRRLEKLDKQGAVESSVASPTNERLPNDRHRREISRREHLQRKRCKRWMKPAKAEEELTVKLPDESNSGSINQGTTALSAPQIVPDSTGEPTITVLLPRRKFSSDVRKDINENVVETVTLIMPRKRSLSSETDTTKVEDRVRKCFVENDFSERRNAAENQINPVVEKKEASTQLSSSDLPAYHMDVVPEVAENCINVQVHRKRKMCPDRTVVMKDQNNSLLNENNMTNYRHQQLNNQFHSAGDHRGETTTEESLSYPSLLSNDLSNHLRDRENQQLDLKVPTSSSNEVVKSQTMIQLHAAANTHPPEPTMPSCCYKSPSAPQLDWKKTCAKKIVKEGAANVKNLIERYNQRAAGSPCTSNLSSPVTPRRAHIPEFSCSPPPTPSVLVNASNVYSPLFFKPTNLDIFPKSPPASPASRARAEALLKAKEKFIASPPEASPILLKRPLIRQQSSPCNTLGAMLPKLNETEPTSKQLQEEDRVSMDSVRLVVLRTGANCQESRRQTRRDQHQKDTKDAKEEEYELKPSKSLSSSSLFKSMLGNEFKTSFPGLLRLKRSRRKKDMATVSQLCRQSLLLSEPCAAVAPSAARSCPSSPELKTKGEPKQPGWFHRNILRHK